MSDNLEYSPYPNVDDAYSITIKQVTDSATGKKEKSKFDRSEFKRRVVEFYGVSRKVVGGKEIFCHLLGWSTYGEVRAARLVPKSLSDDSLVHLFGRELEPRTDPRNALSLSRTLELALDSGDIVFVPVSGEKDAWKCVVTRSEELNHLVARGWTWNDINGLRLKFFNGGRPRKRYLFFRYLITYLQQKRNGNLKWAENIELEYRAWASPGKYLRQSTLRTLLQQATGDELPETMFEMFDTVADSGAESLLDKEQEHREVNVSQAIASAVLDTRRIDANEESEEESDDDEFED